MPDNRPMPLTGDEEIPEHEVLGKPIDNFPSRRLAVLGLGWSILIGVSLLINGALWNVEAEWIGPIVVGGIGTLAWYIGWRILHVWNREVILYERGFTYREGSRDVPFLYGEVRAMRLRVEEQSAFGGILKRTVYLMQLTTYVGDQMKIGNLYRRVGDLTDKLTMLINTPLREAIHERLLAGEEEPFAEYLFVSNSGLRVDATILESASEDARLAWSDFGGYEVKNRQLLLRQDNEVWFAVPLTEVDNLIVLLEILRQYEQASKGNPRS